MLSLEENATNSKIESGEDLPMENATNDEKLDAKTERVHPHHWCGQHKFEADSPTNFYDYTSAKDKEKSAMCRVAEIARFNKLRHYYDLQDESGPAHKKLFTVKLVLSDTESFEGSGPSIKRAQQASAEAALKNTKLPLPTEKNGRKKGETAKPHRVLQTVCRTLQYGSPTYIICNPPLYPDPACMMPQHILLPPTSMPLFEPSMQCYTIDPGRSLGPKLQAVIVNIDGKSLATGIGDTYPLAKQDAAAKALLVLGPVLRERQRANSTESLPPKVVNSANPDEESSTEDTLPNQEVILAHKQKSVISDIHEKAHQLKLNVVFEVLKEEGPPHDRQYVVRCAFVTSAQVVKAEGIGKGKKKKVAQQEACTQLLKTVEPLKPVSNPATLASTVCKTQKKLAAINREPKRKTIVKDKKMDPLYGHQINPVSRLIQVTQAKSKEHPTFELVAEHGVSKYKEFVIKVQYGEEIREGKGPNKRLAKRAAAEAMLESIGYVKPLPPPGKSLLKKMLDTHDPTGMPIISHWMGVPDEPVVEVQSSVPEKAAESNHVSPRSAEEEKREDSPDNEKRRVTFNSQVHACPPPGDQDYPNSIIQSLKKDAIVEGKCRKMKRSKEKRVTLSTEQMQELANRAQLFLDSVKNNTPLTPDPTAHHHLEQMSEHFKFGVHYTSFPPVSKSQFTVVSLGLVTPLVGHGNGCTTADAEEKAAYDAIDKLREMARIALAPQTSPITTSPTPTPPIIIPS